MNEDKKDISILDYSCLLARMYALIIGQNMKLPGGNPYKEQLDGELKIIFNFLDLHKIREDEVIKHVRTILPETNWDKEIREVIEEAKETLEDITSEPVPGSPEETRLLDAISKIASVRKPDYKERLALEKLFKEIQDGCQ